MSERWVVIGWVYHSGEGHHWPPGRLHSDTTLRQAWVVIPLLSWGVVQHGKEFWVVHGLDEDITYKFDNEDAAWMAARMMI